jgi:hypothetical protein
VSFTDTESALIRTYLGVTSTFRFEDTRLESAIASIGDRPEYVTIVQGWLAQLADVETRLTSALSTAGMMKAEDIGWEAGQARIRGIRMEGRRLCSRISVTFGVELRGDAFGESGYQGDGWFGSVQMPGLPLW